MPNEEKWNSRWLEGDTPWSFDEANDAFYEDFPLVAKELSQKNDLSALVPLSGSTNAIKYLRDKEFKVTAVEFSEAAIEDLKKNLFPELDFKISETKNNAVKHGISKHSAKNLTIFKSDFFKFNLNDVSNKKFDLIYDRAAFVAIDKANRTKYIEKLNELSKPGGLLYISLFEWDCSNKKSNDYGPPFSSALEEIEKMLNQFTKVFSKKVKEESVSEKMQKAKINHFYYTHSLFRKNIS